jgi:hypothetical protein
VLIVDRVWILWGEDDDEKIVAAPLWFDTAQLASDAPMLEPSIAAGTICM